MVNWIIIVHLLFSVQAIHNVLALKIPSCLEDLNCTFKNQLSAYCQQIDSYMTQMPCILDWETSSHTDVFLNNKNFRKVPDGCFRGFIRLVNLDLSNNNIEILSDDAFLWLTKLERLTLNSNKLLRINSNHFRQNRKLKFLSISLNRLKIIEENTFLNLNLDSLILTSNFLEDLNFLSAVKSLTRIHLDENSLSLNANNSVFLKGFVELNHVSISSNEINSVGFVEFEDSRLIRTLNLSHSNIKAISSKYFASKLQLTSVDLSHNKIAYIDDKAFLSVCKLIALHLNRNHLLKVPTLSCLHVLSFLDISHNKISSLDNLKLQNLKQLQHLDASNNIIESLDRSGLDELANLVYLDISQNRIKSLSSFRFKMGKLKTVFISLKNFSTNEICLLKNAFPVSVNVITIERYYRPVFLIDRNYTDCRLSLYLMKFLIYFNLFTESQVSGCEKLLDYQNENLFICEKMNETRFSKEMQSEYAIQSLLILLSSILVLLFFCYHLVKKI